MDHELPPIFEPGSYPFIFDPGILPDVFALPFSKSVRKQIGARDNWECQWDGCDRSFQEGWMVQASHLPEHHLKTDPEYDQVSSGQILCIQHHQLLHQLGTDLGPARDAYAANLLAATDPHTFDWHKRNQ